ncbi:unnamed protein product [Gordionus sp. m RMFG-2023]
MPKRLFEENFNDGIQDNKKKSSRIKKIPDKLLIIVLENASLEIIKVGNKYELLNIEKHKQILNKKIYTDLSNLRPDIVHQCLLMLMDSPLNLSGHLKVYIHTQKNVLIEINPRTRIPRTIERFSGLMVQLLQNLSIQSVQSEEKLLKIIKNPVSNHIPIGFMKFGTSVLSSISMKPFELITLINDKTENPDKIINESMMIDKISNKTNSEGYVFVVGAMAHGSVNTDYTEKDISLSEYPLSAALTCSKLCNIFEQAWNIF